MVVYISKEAYIVRALISNGVDINSLGESEFQCTAIMLAAAKGHTSRSDAD